MMSLIANLHVDITLKLQLLFIKNKKKKERQAYYPTQIQPISKRVLIITMLITYSNEVDF